MWLLMRTGRHPRVALAAGLALWEQPTQLVAAQAVWEQPTQPVAAQVAQEKVMQVAAAEGVAVLVVQKKRHLKAAYSRLATCRRVRWCCCRHTAPLASWTTLTTSLGGGQGLRAAGHEQEGAVLA